MQNIRFDQTSKSKINRTDTWEERTLRENAAKDIDIEKQAELMEFWKNVSQNKNLTPAEIKELELQRRISAATEGDSSAFRTERRIKEHQAEVKLEDWRRGQGPSGQSEEEFMNELAGQNESYTKARERARKAVGL